MYPRPTHLTPSTNSKMGDRLLASAKNGRLNFVQARLDSGVDANYKDSVGNTSLMMAVENDQVAVVKLLLDRGADVHATSNDGRSALDRVLHGRISELLIGAIDALEARHAAATNPTTFMGPSPPTVAHECEREDERPRMRSSAFVPFSEISLLQVLSTGQPYTGQLCNLLIGMYRSATVVIKFISSSLEEDASQLERELAKTSLLRHPQLVNVMALCSDVPPCCRKRSALIMELVEWGSLFELLHGSNDRRHISKRHRDKIAVDIADGMRFLHSNGVIHRDLSSHNVLITSDCRAKISNFGLRSSDGWILELDYVPIVTRTTAWNAPEIAERCCEEGWSADYSGDVYSYGVILWELLTGEEPWKELNFYDILHLPDRTLHIPCDLKGRYPSKVRIIENCLDVASARKTFEIICWDLHEVPSEEREVLSFICPISQLPMEDPVMASDGMSYDRRCIEKWFKKSHISPCTNEVLSNKILIPNRQLKHAMEEMHSHI